MTETTESDSSRRSHAGAEARPTVTEIVYTWPDGCEEVRYRRSYQSTEALELIGEVCDLIAKHGPACPYSYRHV